MRKTPRQVILPLAVLVGLLLLASAGTAQAQDPAAGSAFTGIMQHYEAVRLALLSDSLEGVAEHGHEMHGIVEDLSANWTQERAGVSPESVDEARALLPELAAAAVSLAEAADLEAARAAFASLSRPLVRYRKVATGDLPVVAYCSMAKRSWLQPKGELGNPYYGHSMSSCGEVVDG